MKVIITIPAFNEETTIGPVLNSIRAVMRKTKYKYDILVYNDGSTDNTVQVAKKHGAIVISNKRNLGLAETFRREMAACVKRKADIIVHTDADGQYLATDIPRLIKKVEEGYDLVLGSRFLGKIEGMSFMKRFGNKAFAKVFSRLLGMKIADTTTGFRAFTRKVAEEIHFINTFTYTQEQLIRAAKQGFAIAEISINTRKTRPSRLFKNPFQYALYAWINILRVYRDYQPLKFFGSIGTLFFLAGFIIGILIVVNILTTGTAGGTPRIILSALLIITGIQIGVFGFLADMLRR